MGESQGASSACRDGSGVEGVFVASRIVAVVMSRGMGVLVVSEDEEEVSSV